MNVRDTGDGTNDGGFAKTLYWYEQTGSYELGTTVPSPVGGSGGEFTGSLSCFHLRPVNICAHPTQRQHASLYKHVLEPVASSAVLISAAGPIQLDGWKQTISLIHNPKLAPAQTS